MGLKLLFVTGLATGYLLGTKAGRRKYEQIKAKAAQAWEDPRVHKVVSDAQDFVKDAAPVVQAKVSEATAAAADTAKVAGQKMADSAAALRERIMEAVDSVLEKVTQGDEASDHATPPVGSAERPATGPASTPRPSAERPSAEHRPTEHPGESSPSPL